MGYHDESTLTAAKRLVYMRKSLNKWRRWMRKNGHETENAVFIGTGVSGVAAASSLSLLAKCSWGFVRKSTDRNHHGTDSGVQWCHSIFDRDKRTFWIVDDFVSSGRTVKRVLKACDQSGIKVDGVICASDYASSAEYLRRSLQNGLVFIDPHNRTFTTNGGNK